MKSATRVTETSSTLIDHVYVSNPGLIIETNVPIIGISDHFPVTLTLKCKNTRRKGNGHNTIEIRRMDEFNDTEFNHELKVKLELLNQNSNMGVCEQVKNLNMAILSVFNKQVPLKEKRIKHICCNKWFSNELKLMINYRDYLKKHKLEREYKKARNRVANAIKEAKRKYYRGLISSSQGNTRKLWKSINEISDKVTKNRDIPLVKYGNKLFYMSKRQCKYFQRILCQCS